MARFIDRQKAIQLRIKGKSYSQIKKIIGVSKSTLSYWLKDHPLSEERIRELKLDPRRIEKYRATRLRQKQERFNKVYQEEKKNLLPFTMRDLFIAGLFLYWGEGTKTSEARLSVSNTNPAVLKFFITWLRKVFNVPLKKIKIYLHLYSNMSTKREMDFWSKTLSIPLNQFQKPYIKISSSKNINHKGVFGHGTCNVIVGDARLREKVLANLKIIEDKFNN